MNWRSTTLLLAVLAALGSGAQAATLNFACPANPAAGTRVSIGPIGTAGPAPATPATPYTTHAPWTVIGNTTTPNPTIRTYKHSAWWPANAQVPTSYNAEWISINESATVGSFFFRSGDTINVDPTLVDMASIQAVVNMQADNSLTNFQVIPDQQAAVSHAVTTPIYFPNPPTPQTFSNLGFQPGLNRIGFEVQNAEPTQGLNNIGSPMGLVGSVTLTATCLQKTPPVAVDDSYAMSLGQTSFSDNVRTNDTVPYPTTSEWTVLTPMAAAQGSVVLNTDGSFTYTPAAGFTGNATFSYRLCTAANQTQPCDDATVTITVPVPAGPQPDTFAMTLGATSLSTSVVANDTLPANPVWSMVTPPPASAGTVVFNPDGSFVFTPTASFSGSTSFTYKLCSGTNPACGTTTVTITRPAAIPAPVNDAFTIAFGQTLVESVVGNDQSVPATPVWTLLTPPPAADGTLVFRPDGSFTFTPSASFTSSTSFTYMLCSGPNNAPPCAPGPTTVTITTGIAAVTPVPSLDLWAMLSLGALLGALGLRRKRMA